MKLYRLHPKSSEHSTSAPQELAGPTTARHDAQTTEQPDPLGHADFGGVVHSPTGTRRFQFFMATHWRLFFFGIGASGMLLLFADRFALVLSALSQILRPTGLPIAQ